MARREGPLLLSNTARVFLGYVQQRGGDVASLIREFDLPQNALELTEIPIALKAFYAYSDACARAIAEPFLGLEAARNLQRGRYGLVEFIARTAPDVRGGFQGLIRFSGLVNELVRYGLEEGPKDAIVSAAVPGEPLTMGRHSNEFTFVTFTVMTRVLSSRPFSPRRVWFAHAAPEDTRPLEEFFGCRSLEFDRGECGMLFDVGVLDWPLVSSDPELNALLEQQAKKEAQERPAPDDFIGRVREAVRRAMATGAPGIERVAPLLRMSDRTLQRRLEEQGTSFKALVDDVRKAAARMYLDDKRMALSEVAFRLGYSELRSFSRAFRRWMGVTPGEYREQGARGI